MKNVIDILEERGFIEAKTHDQELRDHIESGCQRRGEALTVQRVVSRPDILDAAAFVRNRPELSSESLSLVEFGPKNGSKKVIAVLPYKGQVTPFKLHVYGVSRSGSRWWLAALPFAGLADALTFPVQLLMWVSYSGSH